MRNEQAVQMAIAEIALLIKGTPVVANGVLYIRSNSHLYALQDLSLGLAPALESTKALGNGSKEASSVRPPPPAVRAP